MLIAQASFSLVSSLILAVMFSAACECYKNKLFSKLFSFIFFISCNKNRLEIENSFLREESIVKKTKMTIKILGSVT